jgi:hypothetical protein
MHEEVAQFKMWPHMRISQSPHAYITLKMREFCPAQPQMRHGVHLLVWCAQDQRRVKAHVEVMWSPLSNE